MTSVLAPPDMAFEYVKLAVEIIGTRTCTTMPDRAPFMTSDKLRSRCVGTPLSLLVNTTGNAPVGTMVSLDLIKLETIQMHTASSKTRKRIYPGMLLIQPSGIPLTVKSIGAAVVAPAAADEESDVTDVSDVSDTDEEKVAAPTPAPKPIAKVAVKAKPPTKKAEYSDNSDLSDTDDDDVPKTKVPQARKVVKKTVQPQPQPSDSEEDVKVAIKTIQQSEQQMVTPAAAQIIIADEKFWDIYVHPLGWCDADESKRTRAYVLNVFSNNKKRAEFCAAITELTAPIRTGLHDSEEFTALPHAAQMNFLAHIVGKGRDFYNTVAECPMLGLYLLEKIKTGEPKYQNLWDFLA